MTKLIPLFTLVLFFFFAACTRSNTNTSINASTVMNTVQQGSWKITSYMDSGNDETYHFTGYSFVFSQGAVIATKSGNAISGTYSSGNDDSQTKLYLDFGNTAPFDELNDDWHVLSQSNTKITLQDISGGNGGTDVLVFEAQ